MYWLFLVARTLVARLPLSVCYACSAWVANAAWLLLPEKRRCAIENMSRASSEHGPRRARHLARRSFQNYARFIVDFVRLPSLTAQELAERFEFDDWHRYDEALALGRGCILVLMHFGNWDIGGPVLATRGYPFNVIAETQSDGRFNHELVKLRTHRGIKLIPMEKAATGIIRAMRRNETLAILIDRPLDDGGVDVEFFGERMRIPAGPARIALRTGAKVIVVSQVRISPKSDRVRAIVDFNIETPNSGDVGRDTQTLTQAIMAAHERVIKRHPDQWYAFRRMWRDAPPRDRPAGAPEAVTT
jgi:KDO2-lipid IV(A) lauroyltransferase